MLCFYLVGLCKSWSPICYLVSLPVNVPEYQCWFLVLPLGLYSCECTCVSHQINLGKESLNGVKVNQGMGTIGRSSLSCAMWSYGGPVAWRYRLYFSLLFLVISVGRDWSVHSILEFSG